MSYKKDTIIEALRQEIRNLEVARDDRLRNIAQLERETVESLATFAEEHLEEISALSANLSNVQKLVRSGADVDRAKPSALAAVKTLRVLSGRGYRFLNRSEYLEDGYVADQVLGIQSRHENHVATLERAIKMLQSDDRDKISISELRTLGLVRFLKVR